MEEKEEFTGNKHKTLNMLSSNSRVSHKKAKDGGDSKIAECVLPMEEHTKSFSKESIVENNDRNNDSQEQWLKNQIT